MPLFEFLMILISIIIGLALSEILTGAAGLIRARDTVRFYWIHVFFQFGVFFALFQQWWEAWDLVGVVTIGLGSAILLLFPAIVLFLIAHLLYPRTLENADLEAYYFQQSPILWGLVIAGTAIGTFILPPFEGEPIMHLANISGIPMMAICTVLAISKSRLVHSILAPFVMVLVILDTWFANPTISSPTPG